RDLLDRIAAEGEARVVEQDLRRLRRRAEDVDALLRAHVERPRLGAGRAALAAFPGHFPQPLHPTRAEMERMPEGGEAQRGGRAEARAGAGDHHQPLVAHSEVTSTASDSSRLPSALDR